MPSIFSDPYHVPKLDKNGNPLHGTAPTTFEPGARSVDLISPNLCDQTSWYQHAQTVTDVSLTDVTPQGSTELEFQYPNHSTHVMLNPRKIAVEDGRILMKDGSLAWMTDFWPTIEDDSGDIWNNIKTIDHQNAKVTFTDGFTPTGDVKFSGKVVNKSEFFYYIVKPPPNVEIFVNFVEMQFTLDIDQSANDQPIRVEVLSGLQQVPFHLIPLEMDERSAVIYNTFAKNPYVTGLFEHHFGRRKDYYGWEDFEAVSNVGKNLIPQWSDKPGESIEFPMNYLEGFSLSDQLWTGMRLYIMDTGNSNGPLTGSYGTITLYTKWKEVS